MSWSGPMSSLFSRAGSRLFLSLTEDSALTGPTAFLRTWQKCPSLALETLLGEESGEPAVFVATASRKPSSEIQKSYFIEDACSLHCGLNFSGSLSSVIFLTSFAKWYLLRLVFRRSKNAYLCIHVVLRFTEPIPSNYFWFKLRSKLFATLRFAKYQKFVRTNFRKTFRKSLEEPRRVSCHRSFAKTVS